jgi:hypothetical protein
LLTQADSECGVSDEKTEKTTKSSVREEEEEKESTEQEEKESTELAGGAIIEASGIDGDKSVASTRIEEEVTAGGATIQEADVIGDNSVSSPRIEVEVEAPVVKITEQEQDFPRSKEGNAGGVSARVELLSDGADDCSPDMKIKSRKPQVKSPCVAVGRKFGKKVNTVGRKKDDSSDESDSSIEDVTPKKTPSRMNKTTASKKVSKRNMSGDKSDSSGSGEWSKWSFGKSYEIKEHSRKKVLESDVSSTSGSDNEVVPPPRPPTPPKRFKAKRSVVKKEVKRRAQVDVGECSSSSDGEGGNDTLISHRGYLIPKKAVEVKKEGDLSGKRPL